MFTPRPLLKSSPNMGRLLRKRLRIDIHALVESNDRGKVTRVSGIQVEADPAVALTKQSTNPTNSPLCTLMKEHDLNMNQIRRVSLAIKHKRPGVSIDTKCLLAIFIEAAEKKRKWYAEDEGAKTKEKMI